MTDEVKSGAEMYAKLREAALMRPRLPSMLKDDALDSVYGVVMEMLLPNGSMTVAAFADGAASIYLSNGSGFLGGHAIPAVRAAGANALKAAVLFAPQMQAVHEFRMPETGEVSLYVRTDEGTRGVFCRDEELRKKLDPFLPLAIAMQGIVTEFRRKYQKPNAILQ